MPEQKMTTAEVAEMIGVHPNSVRNYCKRGLLECEKRPTGDRRFDVADVVRFIENARHIPTGCRLPEIRA